MPRATSVPESLRLFVAAYPPAEVATELLRRVARMPLPGSTRMLAPDQVHITLQFIGEVALRDIDEVAESVACSGKGIAPFELTPLRIAAWPQNLAIKRIFVVETDSPSPLRELQRRLSKRLAHKPCPDGDERFVPHMTLARFERPGPYEQDTEVDLPAFLIDRYCLMSSDLKRLGAVHRQLQAFSLSGR